MTVCTPISTCSNNVRCLIGNVHKNRFYDAFSQSQYHCYTLNKHRILHHTTLNMSKVNLCSLTFRSVANPRFHRVNVTTGRQNLKLRLLVPQHTQSSEVECKVGPFTWRRHGASVGLCLGMLACFSTSRPSYAEAPEGNEKKRSFSIAASLPSYSQGKKALNDYSVIGIPGDGRCLFRSVAHGACIRSGKPAPDENLQRQLADELRARVADEFIRRREETEWFIEGEFDTYITQIRKPHVWGGEPELLMASHVLQMPITVYMLDRESGGLISIAEYGQEYGKDNPIKVLYHGYGHYDALHVPAGKGGTRPRL